MPDLDAFGTWILNVLLYVPQLLYQYLTDSVITLLDSAFALCEQCSGGGVTEAWATIPVAVMFIMSWFAPGAGLTLILAAYTVRFVIRRIPGIG